MSLSEIGLSCLVVIVAYLVRGSSGFGSALLAVPLLAHWLPLTLVVPLVATLDVVAGIVLTGAGLRDRAVDWSEVVWLLPGSIVGIAVGLALLLHIKPHALILVLGVVVILFGAHYLLVHRVSRIVSRIWSLPAGAVGGVVGAMFATSSPPYVIYLIHRLSDKVKLRATMSAIFVIEGSLRVMGMLMSSLLLQPELGRYLAIGLPSMAVGLYLGNHVHIGLSKRQMKVLIGCLLLGSGISLVVKALSVWVG